MSPRILFVHNHPTRFVTIDRDLLREHWLVREWYQRGRIVNLAALSQAVSNCDIVFGWFASWHTFWPVLLAHRLKKPSVIIVGGYDTAAMPEIGYGLQRGGFKQWVSRWTMRHATAIITNSSYSCSEISRNIGPDLLEKVYVIPHGLPDTLGALPTEPRERSALTVGNVERSNMYRKGHLPFAQAAALLPDVHFILSGRWRDNSIQKLAAMALPNMTFTNWLEAGALNDYYRRVSVYVQASMHEGFGLSVAEAMLAGCIPVVTRAGSLPQIVGECGIFTESNPRAIAEAVQTALSSQNGARVEARDWILAQFPLKQRRDALRSCVEDLMSIV